MNAYVVYEDDTVVAFLDINPRSLGMCIVAPKKHYKEFDENFELSNLVLQATMKVAEMIKQSLHPKAVQFAVMPSETVQHFHARVYPVFENDMPLIENQPKKVSEQELKEACEKIKSTRVDVMFPVKEIVVERDTVKKIQSEGKPGEKRRSKKAVYWMKREMEVG
jgi:histidine triad (HIT) family protein